MLKAKAEVTALACGVFDNCRDAFGLCEHDVNGFGNTCQTLIFVDLHQVAARVEIQQRQPQLFAALHFIKKRVTGFFQRLFNRMAQVNQVAVVGQNLSRLIMVFFAGGFEFINRSGGERCGTPLTLIFCEQGKRSGFDFCCAKGGIGQTARGADMRSDIFHVKTPVKPARGNQTFIIAG